MSWLPLEGLQHSVCPARASQIVGLIRRRAIRGGVELTRASGSQIGDLSDKHPSTRSNVARSRQENACEHCRLIFQQDFMRGPDRKKRAIDHTPEFKLFISPNARSRKHGYGVQDICETQCAGRVAVGSKLC